MNNNLRAAMRGSCGWTLTELLIIVIIIGVLASLAMPLYTKAVERARYGEAATSLLLIHSAEKMYRLDYTYYCDTLDDDNADSPDLSSYIDDPRDTAKYYNFVILGANADDFCAQATRKTEADKQYHIEPDGEIKDGEGTWP